MLDSRKEIREFFSIFMGNDDVINVPKDCELFTIDSFIGIIGIVGVKCKTNRLEVSNKLSVK